MHIEGVNKIFIQAVQGHIQASWEIQVLIHDLYSYFQSCNQVIVDHVFKEGNRATNWLAKLELPLHSTIFWNQVSRRDFHYIFIVRLEVN